MLVPIISHCEPAVNSEIVNNFVAYLQIFSNIYPLIINFHPIRYACSFLFGTVILKYHFL